MVLNDLERFTNIISGLYAYCNKSKPADIVLDMYYEGLRDFTIEQVQQAVTSAVKARKYTNVPQIGELREIVEGKASDKALLAFEKVRNAIAQHGSYTTVIFDDPIITAIIEGVQADGVSGWQGLCMMDLEKLGWWGKDFVKHYVVLSENPPKYTKKLLGRHDSESQSMGRKPVVIGDPKRVLLEKKEGVY